MEQSQSILSDAEKAHKARRNRDWSLHAHICRRYPFGSEERKQFDAIMRQIDAEYAEANPPIYFQ